MTDITELAQSLKAAAEKATPGNWRAFQYHDGRCGVGGGNHDEIMVCEHISKKRPHDALFIALANPANVLALVEALEKAQQENTDGVAGMAESYETTISMLRSRIAELESFRTAYMEWGDKTDWMQTDKRFDVLKPWGKHRADVLKEYIQHLESRTVKIPEPYAYLRENDGEIQISIGAERPSDRSGGYATPWFAIYTAAGIKVEDE